MTVTTSTNKKTYTGDGSTTAFAYNFKILASTDLKVYTRLIASPYTETLQTEGTHYSVSGVGDAGGGTVTMTSAPADTLQLIILRVVPQTQLTDYTANDAFPAETHEEALDRLAMIVQDQQETLDRSLKVSKTVTDLTTPEFKEPAAARASKFLAFDSDGDELTVTDGPLDDTVITSVADAHVLIYDNADTRWENKAVSGDIAITAAGVASIASGVIVNSDVNASAAIADSKLATISTADKVSGAAVQVDGATDGTSITIANTDKFLIDDAGATKYVNASQINSYVSASVAADDLATGDAAASFETSSGAVVVDSQASTTTIDGHTGVTVQSTNSGDITLDSVADINLDAAGNDITLKAGGTHFGSLTNSSSDLVIESKVSDKDILLKGLDDASVITALTLDMSAAGEASFNAGVKIADDMSLSFGAGPDLTIEYDEDGTDTTRVVAANGLSLAPHGTSSGNTTELRFMELAAGGNNYVGLKAPDACSDSVYTLPAAFPASNKILQSTDAGVLTWETGASGGASLSNDANNRVVTADGSGGINGEANLTFDGSVLNIPDGSAGAPSIGFTSDTDTGVYIVNAGQLGIAAAGALQMRIQDNSIRMQDAGAVDAPSYTWNDSADTGLYFVSPDMRITVDGVFSASFTDDGAGLGNRILFGKTSEGDVGTAGWDFAGTPSTQSNAYGTSLSSHPLLLNRQSNDGTIIEIQQANSTEGTISVSGTTVSYNGAHLSRWSQLANNAKTEIPLGTVMSGIDEMCQWWMESWTDTTLVKGGVVVPREKISSMKLSLGLADGDSYEDEEGDTRTISLKENNQLTRCKISDAESDKAVLGVFEKYESDTEEEKNYNDLVIAQSGDYVIRVGSDFDGEVGDLLESAGDGTAKIQDDDVVRSKTIARVTASTRIHEYEDGSFAVPCILMIA